MLFYWALPTAFLVRRRYWDWGCVDALFPLIYNLRFSIFKKMGET